MSRSLILLACGLLCQAVCSDSAHAWQDAQDVHRVTPRPPRDDEQLHYWLDVMIRHHRYTDEEAQRALGVPLDRIQQAVRRLRLRGESPNPPAPGAPLRLLPYPGGRHPRIGFLDGAIDPQRETKLSVFTPWEDGGYVVLDVPEAIWSNLGLTYLAHTHIPTIWDERGVSLPKMEWKRVSEHRYEITRELPNGIRFTTRAAAMADCIRMDMQLTNGTSAPLSDLRVQNCAMLKMCAGMNQQTNDNKLFRPPYAACRNAAGDRWAISAWEPCHRAWGNAPCPCLHADPKFPDCPPGERVSVRGRFSFYAGTDIEAELARIEATDWSTAMSWIED